MLTSQQGEKIRWTLFTPPREEHTRPSPPPPRSLRPHHCMLMPAYRPLVKSSNHTQTDTSVAGRVVRGTSRLFWLHWLEYVLSRLPHTNNTTDLQDYTETVHCLHHQVHWWCNGHKGLSLSGQPEAVPDRGRSTDFWRLGTLPLELEMRRAWRQLGPTYPAASERPRDSTPGG